MDLPHFFLEGEFNLETLQTIKSRRSIRKYTGEKISKDQLDQILTAAQASPVGMGKYKNLHLTIINNPELLDEIDQNAQNLFKINRQMLYGAPTLILVSTQIEGDSIDIYNVAFSNAACVIENMSLAAVNLGIGTCHIWGAINALNQNSDLVSKLNLPEKFIPAAGILLGVTDEKYSERKIPENRIAMNVLD